MIKRNIFVFLLLIFIYYFIFFIRGYYYYKEDLIKEIANISFWSVIILACFIIINLSGLVYTIKKIAKIWSLVLLFFIFSGIFLLFVKILVYFVAGGVTIVIMMLIFSNFLSFMCAYFLYFIEKRYKVRKSTEIKTKK